MQQKTIGLLGVGVFTHLAIQSFLYPIGVILEDALSLTGLEPLMVFGIVKGLWTFLYLLIFAMLIKRVKNSELESIGKLFLYSILAFIGGNILEFAQPWISHLYRVTDYGMVILDYREGLNEKYQTRGLIDSSLWYFRYALLAFFIYVELNPVKKTSR